MNNTATCSLVNGLLIELHRSLLQYAAESWPWAADEDAALRESVLSLAKIQEKSVEGLVELLRSRKSIVDFGCYPQEYTSLHFVAFGYFLGRLKESQQSIVADLELGLEQLIEDREALELVQLACDRNREILLSLSAAQLPSLA